MLLYRAQSTPTGLRLCASQDNDPATRARGRWFTDDLEAAHLHLAKIAGRAQIVCIEIADGVAESFRVATTPVTGCGLEPIHHSIAPQHDFLIPRFFAEKAEEVETVAGDEPCEIVAVDFGSRREIGRIEATHGDTVLYAERSGSYDITMVSEQTGGSISFDTDGAAAMAQMLMATASARRAA